MYELYLKFLKWKVFLINQILDKNVHATLFHLIALFSDFLPTM